jgi:hypothetical protein
MAQDLGYHVDREAGVEHQYGHHVPEIMEADLRQPGRLDVRTEHDGDSPSPVDFAPSVWVDLRLLLTEVLLAVSAHRVTRIDRIVPCSTMYVVVTRAVLQMVAGVVPRGRATRERISVKPCSMEQSPGRRSSPRSRT